ncbi:MAG: 2-C-methyl-D-erythritol 4-phosphate cytidylyltransferase [Candidatus Omnitrophica bacterium]|nr:2-C-methyl-D-erythritol 4-phosphate cytidylyltransferase [Candidatus Omnitrophota bacterium]HOX53929.1 2-C-methyl-D-erythritol 4-phosphate cytidylyltransferase [Candidatus Omnitrophota bacterium]
MKIVAVVPAAGKGVRLKQRVPKPLVLLDNYSILVHTLRALSRSGLIENIVLVVDKNYLNRFKAQVKRFNLKKIKKIVAGGQHRFDSVRNGILSADSDADLILIHDGVRPFISQKIIKDSICAAKKIGASVVAVPVKSTIKEINPSSLLVKRTLDRNVLWEIQTPQVFKKDIILKAYKSNKYRLAFDDTSLIEKIGKNVRIVPGSYENIKITTPEDLLFAKALLKKKV